MRADFRFVFQDYRGTEAETHIYIEIAGGTTNVSTLANALASQLTPLSSAFLVRCDVTVELLPQISTEAGLSSSVDRRLLFLCRDSDNIADFTLPSPRTDLPYQTEHIYAGIRIPQQTITSDPALSALLALLYRSVTKFGEPFPQGRVVAGVMVNP